MNRKVKLSVNVNKLATLRNARGGNQPNVLEISLKIIKWGAEGITVHPRPDERHIRYSDVYQLKKYLPQNIEFNIEGYPNQKFLELIKKIRPHQCTLVPDPPDVLTSNAGWKIKKNVDLLKDVTKEIFHFTPATRISLFVDPYDPLDESILETKSARVELYTESYAKAFGTSNQNEVLKKFQDAATHFANLDLGINAGHDLDTKNLGLLAQSIPELDEVSIGHALICDALIWGLPETIQRYLNCLS